MIGGSSGGTGDSGAMIGGGFGGTSLFGTFGGIPAFAEEVGFHVSPASSVLEYGYSEDKNR